MTTFLLEKAIYELNYELNNRPDWVIIPLRGIKTLMKKGMVEVKETHPVGDVISSIR
jgi:maltose alpha-D-glucosyltransferase/alpha-amylase